MKIISICKVDWFEKCKKGEEVIFELKLNGYQGNDFYLTNSQYDILFDFKEFIK